MYRSTEKRKSLGSPRSSDRFGFGGKIMKNLLLLTFAGLGERHNVGAPTFWKTVEGFIAAGWKVWIVDVGTKEDTPLGERDYGDGLYIVRFNPPFLSESRIRKIGWFFGFANVFAIRHILNREAGRLINEQHLAADNCEQAKGNPVIDRFDKVTECAGACPT